MGRIKLEDVLKMKNKPKFSLENYRAVYGIICFEKNKMDCLFREISNLKHDFDSLRSYVSSEYDNLKGLAIEIKYIANRVEREIDFARDMAKKSVEDGVKKINEMLNEFESNAKHYLKTFESMLSDIKGFPEKAKKELIEVVKKDLISFAESLKGSLKSTIEAMVNEIAKDLIARVDSLEPSIKALIDRLNVLEARFNDIMKKLNEKEATIVSLQNKLNDYEKTIASLNNQNKELESRVLELEKLNKELVEKISSLESRLTALETKPTGRI